MFKMDEEDALRFSVFWRAVHKPEIYTQPGAKMGPIFAKTLGLARGDSNMAGCHNFFPEECPSS